MRSDCWDSLPLLVFLLLSVLSFCARSQDVHPRYSARAVSSLLTSVDTDDSSYQDDHTQDDRSTSQQEHAQEASTSEKSSWVKFDWSPFHLTKKQVWSNGSWTVIHPITSFREILSSSAATGWDWDLQASKSSRGSTSERMPKKGFQFPEPFLVRRGRKSRLGDPVDAIPVYLGAVKEGEVLQWHGHCFNSTSAYFNFTATGGGRLHLTMHNALSSFCDEV